MILNNGEEWFPEDSDLIEWQRAYPDCDVHSEIAKMEVWLEANPAKRKTPKGIKRFCNAWLNRANEKGGSPMPTKNDGKIPLRQWSSIDDLTHNFMDSPTLSNQFLEQFGQYMTHDGKRVTRD